jgi:hypothetical protein
VAVVASLSAAAMGTVGSVRAAGARRERAHAGVRA